MDVSFGMPLSPPKIIDGVTLKFPAKLWRIVNGCKTGSISWDSSGNSVRIQRKQFEVEYLSTPKYFKTTNFPSFVRQLNIYGFRKIPTSSRWQDNGTVFEYRHDCFIKGHPELLPEVRRNTAVRRTLREAALKNMDLNITQNSIKFPVVSKSRELTGPKQTRKKVDDSHPLLKTKQSTIFKYNLTAQGNGDSRNKITTVYMNPRLTTVPDMQRMSPTKLHEQVIDLLPAMNNSDDEDGRSLKRQSLKQQMNKVHGSVDSRFSDSSNKPFRNPILFLPTTTNESFDMNSATCSFSSLSQESTDSNSGKQLMFSCPVDEDDISDTFNLPCEDDDITTNEAKTGVTSKGLSNTDGGGLDNTSTGLDMLTQQLFMSDSLTQLGDEQGFLTPAYFNPETGTVTLLLPNLHPET